MSHHHYASPFKLLAHTSTYTPACAHATHAEREPLRVVFRPYADIRSYMLKIQGVQSETRFTNACVRDRTFVFTQYSHTYPCACVAHIYVCACACVTAMCVLSSTYAKTGREGGRERVEGGSPLHAPCVQLVQTKRRGLSRRERRDGGRGCRGETFASASLRFRSS
jgi:hypothetical protein